MVAAMSTLVVKAGDAYVSTIQCTQREAEKILPTNEVPTLKATRALVNASKWANSTVKKLEKVTKKTTKGLHTVADTVSGARFVKKRRPNHRDDQQPCRSWKITCKEQTSRVARCSQGAATGIATQTLGEEIGEATRLSLSTAAHTVTWVISVNQLRAAVSPLDFVPLGPRFWYALGARVIR
ncbi:hypothetical protein M758_2G160400 [Ceratodon purpureus]|nr:hypothetical protein M758_2G160400 [Ceratodon purpureus]